MKDWHGEVLQTGAIQKPKAVDYAAELERIGGPYMQFAAHHAPFYAEMAEIAENQAHQK